MSKKKIFIDELSDEGKRAYLRDMAGEALRCYSLEQLEACVDEARRQGKLPAAAQLFHSLDEEESFLAIAVAISGLSTVEAEERAREFLEKRG